MIATIVVLSISERTATSSKFNFAGCVHFVNGVHLFVVNNDLQMRQWAIVHASKAIGSISWFQQSHSWITSRSWSSSWSVTNIVDTNAVGYSPWNMTWALRQVMLIISWVTRILCQFYRTTFNIVIFSYFIFFVVGWFLLACTSRSILWPQGSMLWVIICLSYSCVRLIWMTSWGSSWILNSLCCSWNRVLDDVT